MGSSLSGRRDGKPLVEDCLTIDLALLMRLGPIGEGQAGSGEFHWSIEGQPIGSIRFRLDFRDTNNAALILYFNVSQPDGEHNPKKQTIMLIATPQHFGGRRWWLRCPVTGERVRTLQLPPNGDHFASRDAWGLAYRVERLNRFDRPFEKMFRLQRKLGGLQGLAAGAERPKGMWGRTYAWHIARLERHDAACIEQIVALMEKA
jgi:hypothetical protein